MQENVVMPARNINLNPGLNFERNHLPNNYRGVANWIDIIYGAIFLREKLSQNFMILIWFDVEIWKGSCG